MKSQASKVSFLLAMYALLHLAEACNPYCDCPNVEFPYIDYKNINVATNDPNAGSPFAITIYPDSIFLVAQAAPQFSLFSSAYGCKCISEGGKGDKFPPMAMDVFADRDFNDTLPAGASLRAIFFGQTQGDIVTHLDKNGFRPEPFRLEGNAYVIRTDQRPNQLGEPYHFTIQWVKSNGDTLVAETEEVIFN
jgi:hypothetical protein